MVFRFFEQSLKIFVYVFPHLFQDIVQFAAEETVAAVDFFSARIHNLETVTIALQIIVIRFRFGYKAFADQLFLRFGYLAAVFFLRFFFGHENISDLSAVPPVSEIRIGNRYA